MFGRRRPVPELSSSNFMQRSFGERVAMNSPIQGTAADIIKIAMIRVHDRLLKENLKWRRRSKKRMRFERFSRKRCMERQILRSHLKLMHMSAKTGMRQNKDLSSFMRDDALDCICPDGTREKMDAGSMERMKFIGITGGVGAGKSESVLKITLILKS